MKTDIGGNTYSSGWRDEAISAEEIEAYKQHWAKHGFPDCDVAYKSRWSSGIGNLNEPTAQPIAEQLLWQAVLEEAVVDYDWGRRSHLKPRDRKLAEEARDWFASNTSESPSFVWVCNSLGLSVSYFRARLADKKREPYARRRYVVADGQLAQRGKEAA